MAYQGRRYFAGSYFAPRYFGAGASSVPAGPQISGLGATWEIVGSKNEAHGSPYLGLNVTVFRGTGPFDVDDPIVVDHGQTAVAGAVLLVDAPDAGAVVQSRIGQSSPSTSPFTVSLVSTPSLSSGGFAFWVLKSTHDVGHDPKFPGVNAETVRITDDYKLAMVVNSRARKNQQVAWDASGVVSDFGIDGSVEVGGS